MFKQIYVENGHTEGRIDLCETNDLAGRNSANEKYSAPVVIGRHFGFPHKSPWDDFASYLAPKGQFTWFREIIEDLDHGLVNVNGFGEMLMLGGYSYLGLNRHPHIQEAVIQAMNCYGTGTSGSRWLAGHTSLHKELELQLADLHGTDDAVVFSSGYTANVSTIASLVKRNDVVITDKSSHASIIDGCRFAQATFKRFRFKDLAQLEKILQQNMAGNQRRLVVVDGVYSMSGALLEAEKIAALCQKYEAALMVDECHSHFVLGENGRGIKEHFNLNHDDITLEMGTLSKAIPANGGYIAASADICNFLRRAARGFIYSGATSPVMIAASLAAIRVFRSEGPALIEKLNENTRYFREALCAEGINTANHPTPIVAIQVGPEKAAAAAAAICQQRGLFIHPVFPPVVPAGKSILRASIMANHRKEDLRHAASIIGEAVQQSIEMTRSDLCVA